MNSKHNEKRRWNETLEAFEERTSALTFTRTSEVNKEKERGGLVINHFRLPNVKSVKVLDGGLHDWLANFGIVSKSTNRKLELIKYSRTGNHRYLAYMEKRLLDLADKRSHTEYWRVAEHFLTKSNLLFIWSLRKVELNWHRKFSMTKVLKLWKEWRTFFALCDGHIKLKRVWIQSPAKKERGLSVPAVEHRVTAAGLTKILEIWVTPIYAEWQHAYISNRGCGTAWRYFFKNLYSEKNLLEFDLKNFFPSVDHQMLECVLRDYGISDFFTKLMLVQIKQTLDPPKSLEIPDIATGAPTIRKKSMWELYFHENEPTKSKRKKMGVPMGLAIAPLLAVLILQHAIKEAGLDKRNKFVIYADDGLIAWSDGTVTYKQKLEEFSKALAPYGVEVNHKKSQLLKSNGKWIHRVKFLGMFLDPFTDIWSSETRKGNSLKLDLTALRVTNPNGRWIDNFIVLQFSKNSRYHRLFKWYAVPEQEILKPFWIASLFEKKHLVNIVEKSKFFREYIRKSEVYISLKGRWETWTVLVQKIFEEENWIGRYLPDYIKQEGPAYLSNVYRSMKKTSVERYIESYESFRNRVKSTKFPLFVDQWGKSKFRADIRRGFYEILDASIQRSVRYMSEKYEMQWELPKVEDHYRQPYFRPYQVLHKMVIGGVQMMAIMWLSRKQIIEDIYLTSPGGVATKIETASLNWRNVIYSKYLGDIMARMYIGRWDVDMEQDFSMKYKTDSFMALYDSSGESNLIKSLWRDGLEMSVFTSTTVTWQMLSKVLRQVENFSSGKWVGPEILDLLPSWVVDGEWAKKDSKLMYRKAKQQIEVKRTKKIQAVETKRESILLEWISVFIDYTKAVYLEGQIRRSDLHSRKKYFNDWFTLFRSYLDPKKIKPISGKSIRRRVRMNRLNWLYNLGIIRDKSGKALKFNRRKSSQRLTTILFVPSVSGCEINGPWTEELLGYEWEYARRAGHKLHERGPGYLGKRLQDREFYVGRKWKTMEPEENLYRPVPMDDLIFPPPKIDKKMWLDDINDSY